MVKRIKDKNNLIKYGKLPITKRHYYRLYFWKDRQAMLSNTVANPDGTAACCCFEPTRIRIYEDGKEEIDQQPKLGELHFVDGYTSDEIIAHELGHALLHRMRVLTPTAQDVMNQEGQAEEEICYQLGEAFVSVKEWLNQS